MASLLLVHDDQTQQYTILATTAQGEFLLGGPYTDKAEAEAQTQRIIGLLEETAAHAARPMTLS